MGSNFCQICEDFQMEKPNGNASIRREYNQPTCYDHVGDFQKFREKIDFETKAEKCRSDLTSEATKFTDLKLDKKSIDEALKKFTPEQLYQFKEKIKTGIFDIDELGNINEKQPSEQEDAIENKVSSASMHNSSRSPIKCPVNDCAQIIGLTSILSHFLLDHQKRAYALSYQEIKRDENVKLEFSHKLFKSNKVFCLGVLVYSGDGKNLPAEEGLCQPNSFLPEKYEKFSHHLPVLILGAKTSLKYMLDEPELTGDDKEIDIDIFIVWTATIDVTKKVHCTLTAFDKNGMNSRSTIVTIRSLKKSQLPNEFLSKESNYLILNCGEINLLTRNETENIFLDINIQQYE